MTRPWKDPVEGWLKALALAVGRLEKLAVSVDDSGALLTPAQVARAHSLTRDLHALAVNIDEACAELEIDHFARLEGTKP